MQDKHTVLFVGTAEQLFLFERFKDHFRNSEWELEETKSLAVAIAVKPDVIVVLANRKDFIGDLPRLFCQTPVMWCYLQGVDAKPLRFRLGHFNKEDANIAQHLYATAQAAVGE